MLSGECIQAASEVPDDILTLRTPANSAPRAWGKSNRFAGSRDSSAIGNFVHDAPRQTSSPAFRMDDASLRALAPLG
ncbi:MAG: hypothetical protein GDA35_04670 [Hyphomonadaceae bacterium]|nr:hypothetical protein [Hyphomonadaceae bacterium]